MSSGTNAVERLWVEASTTLPSSPDATRVTRSTSRCEAASRGPCVSQQSLSGRSELNLTAGAREQDRAEPSLELPDGRAERRLRQMQALRRASEARLFRDDHEVTQLA
jgi:hypothetical protein